MSTLFLSRARVRRDVPAAALWRQLVPQDDNQRMAAGHRLVWTLFSDSADRARDFLWREAEPGLFYFLSRRPPEDRHNLFHVDPPKRFAPELARGDVLRFSLRANATVARRPEGEQSAKARGKPTDVVMDTLYRGPQGRDRAGLRRVAIESAGTAWLTRRASTSGFRLATNPGVAGTEASVTGYRVLRMDHGKAAIQIGVLDYDGLLVVEDPGQFVDAIARGFGRAKAFGCGLMLIRRP